MKLKQKKQRFVFSRRKQNAKTKKTETVYKLKWNRNTKRFKNSFVSVSFQCADRLKQSWNVLAVSNIQFCTRTQPTAKTF